MFTIHKEEKFTQESGFIHPLYTDIASIEKCHEIAQSDCIEIDTDLGKRFVSARTFLTYKHVDNGCFHKYRNRYELIPNGLGASLEYMDDKKAPLFYIKIGKDGSGLEIISDKIGAKECLLAIKEALLLADKAANSIRTIREQTEQDRQIKQFIQEKIVNDFYDIGEK